MKLVVVESPAKCNTIQKYLGEDYKVVASLGHIRDLATRGKGNLGVDIDNNFEPTYAIDKDKTKVVRELRKIAKDSEEVILATDPDREGEAIAWHIAQVLGLDVANNKRLEFHEITKDSILNAISNPRTINLNLVSSQETRRILDRILGFKLSKLLFQKIHSRSAGRVQSATLKLIYDHEEAIKAFVSEEYWKVNCSMILSGNETPITYEDFNGQYQTIKTKEDAEKILNSIGENVSVTSVKKSVKSVESKMPFTTSTMQQSAFARLKFSTKKTQLLAQKLYEGIDLGNNDRVGLITYMRTDSTRLSAQFIDAAKEYIVKNYGEEYLGKVKSRKTSNNIQDAHEAIRPTSLERTPKEMRKYLSNDEYNLYLLIYNQALAALMSNKKEDVLTVKLTSNGVNFKFETTKTIFKGFEILEKETKVESDLPEINIDDSFLVSSKSVEQKFTQPPAKLTEAKVVKLMEEKGIGRPSTYASTIDLLKKRKYITVDKGVVSITEQGWKTAHVLDKYFPKFIQVEYTANMEKSLDDVEKEGTEKSKEILSSFYEDFMEAYDKNKAIIYKDVAVPTGEMCPVCGKPLIYREGRNGQFIGCSDYPNCKYIKKEPKPAAVETGEMCPSCGKPLVIRHNKKGEEFIACSGFPSCRYIKVEKKEEDSSLGTCPTCGAPLVKKRGKYGYFIGCSNYPTCHYMQKIYRTKKTKNDAKI